MLFSVIEQDLKDAEYPCHPLILTISVVCLPLKVQDFCRFKPCFPGVPCFNDPATQLGFECGECPLGMLGDGVNCTDVDEVTARESNNRKS